MSVMYNHTSPLSFSLLSNFALDVCVCAAARPAVELKLRMFDIGAMRHVYRNSMDRGMGLAWLMANGLKSDLSDITLHVNPTDFH